MIENVEKSWFWILTNRKMFQCWPTLTETWIQSLNLPCQRVQKSIDHAQPCSMDSIIYLADVQKHAKLVLLIQNVVFCEEQAISPLIFNMVDVKRSWCQTNELSYALVILARHVPGKFLIYMEGPGIKWNFWWFHGLRNMSSKFIWHKVKCFFICSYDGEKIYDEESSTHEHRYSRLTSYRGEPFAVGHYHNSGSEHNKVELMTLDSKKWKDMPNYPTHRA